MVFALKSFASTQARVSGAHSTLPILELRTDTLRHRSFNR
jgi:hypothetical protein